MTPARPAQGSGLTMQRKRYRVNVPAGVHDAEPHPRRRQGRGEPRAADLPGDLYVRVRVAPSPIFARRSDGNLEVRVPITIPEAINGATVEVPTLDGTKRIRVPAGTQHGTIQRLRGEGPPRPGGRGRRDIHYRLEIEVPSDLAARASGPSTTSPRRSTATTRASAS